MKNFFFLISLLAIGYWLLAISALPVLADEQPCLYQCCASTKECQGRHPEGDRDCHPRGICCESCSPPDTGIANPVIGIFGTQAGELTLASIFASLLRLALVAAGLLLLFNLVSAGIQWMTTGGDKAGIQTAQARITNAFIGLILVVLVLVVIAIVNEVLKINILQPSLPTP